MRRARRPLAGIIPALAAILAATAPASAQRIYGTLLEEGTRRPVIGARVVVVDSLQIERAETTTDEDGDFEVKAPDPGHYRLRIEHIAYSGTPSEPLRLGLREFVRVRVFVPPAAVALDPIEVRILSNRERRLRALGGRIIDRDRIDAMRDRVFNVGDIIRWSNIPGLLIRQSAMSTCVRMVRARGGCMQVYLDDMPLYDPTDVLDGFDPELVEAIVVLSPLQASTFYGGRSHGGVLLIYTRSGW